MREDREIRGELLAELDWDLRERVHVTEGRVALHGGVDSIAERPRPVLMPMRLAPSETGKVASLGALSCRRPGLYACIAADPALAVLPEAAPLESVSRSLASCSGDKEVRRTLPRNRASSLRTLSGCILRASMKIAELPGCRACASFRAKSSSIP